MTVRLKRAVSVLVTEVKSGKRKDAGRMWHFAEHLACRARIKGKHTEVRLCVKERVAVLLFGPIIYVHSS